MNSSPSILFSPDPGAETGKKVLLYYYKFASELGGSDYLPLLFIAELQRRGCDVTLALDWESDLERAANLYHVDLDAKRVHILTVKPKNRFIRRLDSILPFYRVRQLKKMAKHADVCISTANMIDFGKPAHHIVYLMRLFGDNAFNDFCQHRPPLSGFPRLKRRILKLIAEGFLRPLLGVRSTRKILADQRESICVPSRYVADTMRTFYGPFNCTVFYPPTSFDIPPMEIERDPMRVIYLGRIQREKGILEIVEIVERTREISGLDIHLHLAGPLTPGNYTENLKQIVAEKAWIQLVDPVYGKEKAAFLLSGTYAIHAERDEAFGISITEYLKAGCIPVVPDEGGTPEVVGNPALTYHTNEDAARLLTLLITDEAFRLEQMDRCKERALAFSFDHYMKEQHIILDRILEEPL